MQLALHVIFFPRPALFLGNISLGVTFVVFLEEAKTVAVGGVHSPQRVRGCWKALGAKAWIFRHWSGVQQQRTGGEKDFNQTLFVLV